MMDLSNAKAVIIIFTMNGCGACEEYIPRFRELARQFKGSNFPILECDVRTDDVRINALANRFGVAATPTTIIANRGNGAKRYEGSLSNEGIQYCLQLADAIQKRV